MTSQDPSATSRWIRRIRNLTAPKDRSQLRELLRDAQSQGLLDGDALSMLEGVLDVSDLQVRDIMVPHNQMICVRVTDAPQRLLQVAIDSGHSRFPVLDDDGENIVGILLAKDLLRLHSRDHDAGFDLTRILRKALFVPESKRVNVLLKELRVGRNHLAIAVDEYGSIAGLVTIEDVIEQIVGEIDDEYDVDDEKDIRPEIDSQYSVRGATRIGDFNSFFNAHFPDDEFDTVAGLVTQHFGRLPRRGEAAILEGFEFRVVRADRRCIEMLRVTAPETSRVNPDAWAGASEDSG